VPSITNAPLIRFSPTGDDGIAEDLFSDVTDFTQLIEDTIFFGFTQ